MCNEDGDVVGLLDITKVFHEALGKVERSSNASAQLHAALAGVQSELGPGIGGNPQAAAMLAYVEALKEKMALPDLTTVMNTGLPPPVVTARTTVREAAKLMKDRRTTAVCVMESAGASGGSAVSGMSGVTGAPKIAGIFTSKDVVLRVGARGVQLAARLTRVRHATGHCCWTRCEQVFGRPGYDPTPGHGAADYERAGRSEKDAWWVVRPNVMQSWLIRRECSRALPQPPRRRGGRPPGRYCRRPQAHVQDSRAGTGSHRLQDRHD